jgi:hypothetical protein
MQVRSAYDRPIGPITAIWPGRDPLTPDEPCDLERCSRLQVRHHTGPLYIPYSAIEDVAKDYVTLNVEAAQAARGPWRYRPDWLPPGGWTPPLY